MLIRDAVAADLKAITDLYNAWIPSLTTTWTEESDTYDQRAAWFESQARAKFPILVAEDTDEVVGFASYGPFRGEGKWPGYRGTLEHSVHVREDHWGSGIGRALVEGLIERAHAADLHVLVGAIDAENEGSIQFHVRLGFVEVARMPETRQKFGRWLDLVLMQKILDSRLQP